MTPIELVYVGSLLLGGGYLAIASVLHFVAGDHGGGHDADVDAGADVDHGGFDVDTGIDVDGDLDAGEVDANSDLPAEIAQAGNHALIHADTEPRGVSFFSPLVLSTLLFSFGLMGFVVHHWVVGLALVSLAAAAAAAVLGGGSTYWSINRLSQVEGSSETRVGTLLGHQATVSVAIPAKGFGEIVYERNQSRYNAPARSREGVVIPRGATVFIGGIEGSTFEVEEARGQRIRRLAAAEPDQKQGE